MTHLTTGGDTDSIRSLPPPAAVQNAFFSGAWGTFMQTDCIPSINKVLLTLTGPVWWIQWIDFAPPKAQNYTTGLSYV